jgi:hypothetical protein
MMLGNDAISINTVQQTLDEKRFQDIVAVNFNLDPEKLAAERSAQMLAQQALEEEEYEQAPEKGCMI